METKMKKAKLFHLVKYVKLVQNGEEFSLPVTGLSLKEGTPIYTKKELNKYVDKYDKEFWYWPEPWVYDLPVRAKYGNPSTDLGRKIRTIIDEINSK